MSNLEEIQMRSNLVADDTLESTRRIVRLCEESEDVGVKTLVMLDDQGEQLTRIEDDMDAINANMLEAEKQLSNMERCCKLFSCCSGGTIKTKDDSKAWKSKDKETTDATTSQPSRVDTYSKMDVKQSNGGYIQRITNDAREDEMDANMGMVSNMLGNLRNMAVDMGSTLDRHNQQVDRINLKAQSTEGRIESANKRVIKLMKN